jgi:primosomal protein N' (replication factor Y)
MTQVAGRAGRSHTPGHVVIQTVTPDLPAFGFALRHDYESFAEAELQSRETFGLPPFRRLARIVIAHPRDEIARIEADALATRIQEAIKTIGLFKADVWGPSPCALARLRGTYRHELTIRTANASDMRALLQSLQQAGSMHTKADSTIVDVDPVAMG